MHEIKKEKLDTRAGAVTPMLVYRDRDRMRETDRDQQTKRERERERGGGGLLKSEKERVSVYVRETRKER